MLSNKCYVPGCKKISTSKFGVPQKDRNAGDYGKIKLVLYF